MRCALNSGLIYGAGIGGEQFSSAQHSGSLSPARLMAKQVALSGRRRLLDVGGGNGAYSLAFCAANPQLTATLLDFPQTIDTAQTICAEGGRRANRTPPRKCNYDRLAHRARCDSDVLSWSAVRDGDVGVLAQCAIDALSPGGLVLVRHFMVGNAGAGPPFAAWYLLGSIFDNPDAVCLTPAHVESALRQVRFQIDSTEIMLPGITMLTMASKPG